MDISKEVATFLRSNFSLCSGHAREIAASYFGFKSHSAFLSERIRLDEILREASYIAPDIEILRDRMQMVGGMQISERQLAEEITAHLKKIGAFRGTAWLAESWDELNDEISVTLYKDIDLSSVLADFMALTNAAFLSDYFDSCKASIEREGLRVIATGQTTGETHEDKINHGERIDFTLNMLYRKTKLRIAFKYPDIEADGEVEDPYA